MNELLSPIDTLHPLAKEAFAHFEKALIRDPDLSCMRAFTGFRSPDAQAAALAAGHSKVGPWRSVHAYGFACDFVPCPEGKWTWWNADDPRWDRLHRLAERVGLLAPIKWDKPHIILAGWKPLFVKWLNKQTFT